MIESKNLHCFPVDYEKTGLFSQLVIDYINQNEKLMPFVSNFPSIDDFESIIENKKNSFKHRNTLVDVLLKQYKGSGIDDEVTLTTIRSLADENTFTVTTGQQIVLFTGPLYFPFKIISTIQLAQKLKKKYPDQNFVPIFWMATEDHDFEEINHVFVQKQKFTWKQKHGGPVGRLATNGINDLISEVEHLIGKSEWTVQLRKAYQTDNLANATRKLVHQLFGDLGLIVIDGDDAVLKSLFASVMEQDITEQHSSNCVENLSKELAKDYKIQVNSREINFFYQTHQSRNRIEKSGNDYVVKAENKRWSETELKQNIQNDPSAFSPNVLMRPLYQETILPNLAYIGGGAEVAYWLQLKSTFDFYEIPFPLLILRNHAAFFNAVDYHRLKNLKIKPETLFLDYAEIAKLKALETADFDISLCDEKKQLAALCKNLQLKSKTLDPTLSPAAGALGKRFETMLEQYSHRLIRAQKRKIDDDLRRVVALQEVLFPLGTLQERKVNLLDLEIQLGWENIRQNTLNHFDVFDLRFMCFLEG
jgi:bacillithiol biosynthesis cysteine-adding enzyme BshC